MTHFFTGILLLLLLLGSDFSYAQDQDIFRPKMPERTDTIYYRFYHGIQMIEVDNLDYYDRKIFYLEQAYPRAMPYTMLEPPPDLNVYIFRDSTGKIVKAFNTTQSIDELNKHFIKIPVNKKSTSFIRQFNNTHRGKADFADGVWPYSPNRFYFYNGLYKIADYSKGVKSVSTRIYMPVMKYPFGLIDSLGNVVIPAIYDEILPAGENFVVCKDSLWGILDRKGQTVLNMKFTSIKHETNNIITFSLNNKIGAILDYQQNKIIIISWFDRIFFGHNRFGAIIPYSKEGKTGFLSNDFEVLTEPRYDFTDYFLYNGQTLARVCKNKKWGFIDTTGAEVIPCIYDDSEPFNENQYTTVQQGKNIFCIDKNGCKAEGIEAKMKLQSFNSAEIVSRNSRYGLRDQAGEIVLPVIFDNIALYHDTVYRVKKNEKSGLYTKNGKELLPCIYEEISPYSDKPLTIVRKDAKYGVVNRRMAEISPCMYESARTESQGIYLFMLNGKWGMADTSGKTIAEAVYDNINVFRNSAIAQVQKDSLFGFINIRGEIIIPVIYKQLGYTVMNNRVWFLEDGKYGFLDSLGKKVIPAKFDKVSNFEKEICGVAEKDEWYFINLRGKKINNDVYDFIDSIWMVSRLIKVRKNGLFGIADENGKLVYPCRYEEIRGYSSQGITVKANGKDMLLSFPD